MRKEQKEMYNVGDIVIIVKKNYRITRVFKQEKSYCVEATFEVGENGWKTFYPCHDEITGKVENNP